MEAHEPALQRPSYDGFKIPNVPCIGNLWKIGSQAALEWGHAAFRVERNKRRNAHRMARLAETSCEESGARTLRAGGRNSNLAVAALLALALASPATAFIPGAAPARLRATSPVCTLHRGGTAGGKNPAKGKPPGPLGKAGVAASKKITVKSGTRAGDVDAEAAGVPQCPQNTGQSTGRGVLPLLEKAAAVNPQLYISTPNPTPHTLHPKPYALGPRPQTLTP